MAYVQTPEPDTYEDFDIIMADCDNHFEARTEGQDLFALLADGANDMQKGKVRPYREAMAERKKRLDA